MPLPDSDSHLILSSRRSFLTRSALLVSGLAASTSISSGFLFRRTRTMDLDFLPVNWVRRVGENKIQAYAEYLQALQLKLVTPEQVIKAHARAKGSLWNTLPERSAWRNMGRTLKVTDRVAAHLGMPVAEVTSAFRSKSYNRRCPGAKSNSWHLKNFALDLKFEASPYRVASAARRVRNQGYFRGGIGRYPEFTHIDTRGINVDW
jgi:hypothetical protein